MIQSSYKRTKKNLNFLVDDLDYQNSFNSQRSASGYLFLGTFKTIFLLDNMTLKSSVLIYSNESHFLCALFLEVDCDEVWTFLIWLTLAGHLSENREIRKGAVT